MIGTRKLLCKRPSQKKQPSPLAAIPSELLHRILLNLPSQRLVLLRPTNSHFSGICDYILKLRFIQKTKFLQKALKKSREALDSLDQDLSPHLTHYRHFVRNLTPHEIQEASWYSNPPKELHAVCTCLCLLKMGRLVIKDEAKFNFPTGDMMSWTEIKKIMKQTKFRQWFQNLRQNVDFLEYTNVKIVERLIQHDQSITYERLRDVSDPGYRLLIIVAACLQYGNISEDLKVERRVKEALEEQTNRLNVFLGYLQRSDARNVVDATSSSSLHMERMAVKINSQLKL